MKRWVGKVQLKPIGTIHTPFKYKKDTPIQPAKSKALGQIEVFKKYQEGLEDIDGFSHLILLYKFHKSKGYRLKVKPFLDNKKRGVFATRFPKRPNQIGLTVVKLVKRKNNILIVKGIDVIDGTPLLDVKPHIPEFRSINKIKIGWLEGKIK